MDNSEGRSTPKLLQEDRSSCQRTGGIACRVREDEACQEMHTVDDLYILGLHPISLASSKVPKTSELNFPAQAPDTINIGGFLAVRVNVEGEAHVAGNHKTTSASEKED